MAPVYATPADLATYVDMPEPPANADRLLKRASRLVDLLLIGAVYRTDEAGAPVDQAVADALADATVVQAAYWHEHGEPGKGEATYDQVSIGSVSLSRREGAATSGELDGQTVAPGVLTILQLAGLTPAVVQVIG